MKKVTTLLLLVIFMSNESMSQQLKWIPFHWEGSEMSNKYFDKLSISIPVKVENLPYKFSMQFDLGATSTMFYGNSIAPYLDKYATSLLSNKK